MAFLARPAVMAVSDSRRLDRRGRSLADAVAAWAVTVAQAGVPLLYLREPALDDATLAEVARRVVRGVDGTGCRVLVRDRADLAVLAGAHGVHLSSSAIPARRARALLAADALLGRSVHGVADAAGEPAEGCDYLLAGTIYPSASKPPGHPSGGAPLLQAIAAAVPLPVLAIGGVNAERLPEIAGCGAAGFAAIGLFAPAAGGPAGEELSARIAMLMAAARAAFASAGAGGRRPHHGG